MTARPNPTAFVASRQLPVWRAGWLLLIFAAWLASTPLWAEAPHHEFTQEQREHWAFQKVRLVDPPKVRNARWVKTSIDAFVLAELENKKLAPAPEADKGAWLRRASLDLTGLPPSPDELDRFQRDKSSRAYENAVDRLLSSPHYGERWARHWLDLARYAESEGFKADETRPNAWRYRDYVIRAFNDDKPYDRFLREQIAGDELWPDNPEALIATGFNRHYPDESNARNLMQRRQEILNDITDTVGAVFTGLTYACARCHNHKWDPILQADYYRLQAYFANTAANDNIILAPPETVRRHDVKLAAWSEKTRVIREEMEEIERPHREAIIKDYVEKYPDEIQAALNKPVTERNAFECQMVAKAMLYLDPQSHQYLAPIAAVTGRFKIGEKERWQDLKTQLDEFASMHPGKLPMGTGMTEVTDEFPATHVLRRGIFDAPRDEVQPGFLTLLESVSRPAKVAKSGSHTGRRTELANLLADPENPLTARVMVNRVWHYHFGRGLAGSPSDFGIKGERPTHPELLDWLATEFVRSGWSIKHLHRLIMTSAVYQQSSRVAAMDTRSAKRAGDLAARVDPDNKLLWHFPRTRLEGETIRDAALLVSGRLNPKPGGPSIFPELPSGMESRGGWKVNEDVRERDRRSVYVFVRRNTRYPMFESFDMPDTHESCARRNVTTSPIQALALLNSKLTLEWAQSFAGRVLSVAGANPGRQIDTAWQLAYARHPDAQELALAREFLEHQARLLGERQAGGEALALPAPSCDLPRAEQGAALVDFCHALLNSNEFVYRD